MNDTELLVPPSAEELARRRRRDIVAWLKLGGFAMLAIVVLVVAIYLAIAFAAVWLFLWGAAIVIGGAGTLLRWAAY